jgi:Cu/Zn superoxide dismutase
MHDQILNSNFWHVHATDTFFDQHHHVEPVQYVYPENTPQHQAAQQGVASASCTLGPSSPEGLVRGMVTLHQNHPGAPVLVSGSVEGLIPGLHGFHLHRDGNTADGCKAAGPHFNPANVSLHLDREQYNRCIMHAPFCKSYFLPCPSFALDKK